MRGGRVFPPSPHDVTGANPKGTTMTLKILSAAALALSLTAGVAMAQDNSTTGSTTNATDQAEMEAKKPFYSDEGMTTLRPMEEFTGTFNSMSAEQQAAMRAKCQETLVQSPKDEFCVSVNSIQMQ